MCLYTKTSNMWYKDISYEKTWSDFNNLFMEYYYYLWKLQRINANQEVFRGCNMDITIQDKIAKELDNLAMYKNSGKDVLT